ncbi:P12 family lipoprotein [Borreliella garinii]|uniref:P12 family lipoprotein n=2 Tax=Borreliella garinii TaxID=29519 RepID=UPI003977BA7B
MEDVCELRNEYHLIRNDFYEVITKIYEKKTSLIKYFSNNEGKIRKLVQLKIRELVQLQNNLKIEGELDQLIVHIDAAGQGIRSAAFFFDEAQKSLKEGIIKRVESRNRLFDASRLSRRALNKAEDALSNLESSSYEKIEAMGRSKIIKTFIQHAKTILSKFE